MRVSIFEVSCVKISVTSVRQKCFTWFSLNENLRLAQDLNSLDFYCYLTNWYRTLDRQVLCQKNRKTFPVKVLKTDLGSLNIAESNFKCVKHVVFGCEKGQLCFRSR